MATGSYSHRSLSADDQKQPGRPPCGVMVEIVTHPERARPPDSWRAGSTRPPEGSGRISASHDAASGQTGPLGTGVLNIRSASYAALSAPDNETFVLRPPEANS
jgi:hypothetical protein